MANVKLAKPRRNTVTATVKEKAVKVPQKTYDELLAALDAGRRELLTARAEVEMLNSYRQNIRTQLGQGELLYAEHSPRLIVFGYHYPQPEGAKSPETVTFPSWPGWAVRADTPADIPAAISEQVERHVKGGCEMRFGYQEPPMTGAVVKYRVDIDLATGKVVRVRPCV